MPLQASLTSLNLCHLPQSVPLQASLTLLNLCHCPMLPLAALPTLSCLTGLTELRASGLRCMTAPSDPEAFDIQLEEAFACLTELQVGTLFVLALVPPAFPNSHPSVLQCSLLLAACISSWPVRSVYDVHPLGR